MATGRRSWFSWSRNRSVNAESYSNDNHVENQRPTYNQSEISTSTGCSNTDSPCDRLRNCSAIQIQGKEKEGLSNNYHCPKCSSTFPSQDELTWHNRIHTEIQRWKTVPRVHSGETEENSENKLFPSFAKPSGIQTETNDFSSQVENLNDTESLTIFSPSSSSVEKSGVETGETKTSSVQVDTYSDHEPVIINVSRVYTHLAEIDLTSDESRSVLQDLPVSEFRTNKDQGGCVRIVELRKSVMQVEAISNSSISLNAEEIVNMPEQGTSMAQMERISKTSNSWGTEGLVETPEQGVNVVRAESVCKFSNSSDPKGIVVTPEQYTNVIQAKTVCKSPNSPDLKEVVGSPEQKTTLVQAETLHTSQNSSDLEGIVEMPEERTSMVQVEGCNGRGLVLRNVSIGEADQDKSLHIRNEIPSVSQQGVVAPEPGASKIQGCTFKEQDSDIKTVVIKDIHHEENVRIRKEKHSDPHVQLFNNINACSQVSPPRGSFIQQSSVLKWEQSPIQLQVNPCQTRESVIKMLSSDYSNRHANIHIGSNMSEIIHCHKAMSLETVSLPVSDNQNDNNATELQPGLIELHSKLVKSTSQVPQPLSEDIFVTLESSDDDTNQQDLHDKDTDEDIDILYESDCSVTFISSINSSHTLKNERTFNRQSQIYNCRKCSDTFFSLDDYEKHSRIHSRKKHVSSQGADDTEIVFSADHPQRSILSDNCVPSDKNECSTNTQAEFFSGRERSETSLSMSDYTNHTSMHTKEKREQDDSDSEIEIIYNSGVFVSTEYTKNTLFSGKGQLSTLTPVEHTKCKEVLTPDSATHGNKNHSSMHTSKIQGNSTARKETEVLFGWSQTSASQLPCKPYICNDCLETFSTADEYNNHSSVHAKTKQVPSKTNYEHEILRCSDCSVSTLSKKDINKDTVVPNAKHRVQTESKRFKCPSCTGVFDNFPDMVMHFKIHDKNNSFSLQLDKASHCTSCVNSCLLSNREVLDAEAQTSNVQWGKYCNSSDTYIEVFGPASSNQRINSEEQFLTLLQTDSSDIQASTNPDLLYRPNVINSLETEQNGTEPESVESVSKVTQIVSGDTILASEVSSNNSLGTSNVQEKCVLGNDVPYSNLKITRSAQIVGSERPFEYQIEKMGLKRHVQFFSPRSCVLANESLPNNKELYNEVNHEIKTENYDRIDYSIPITTANYISNERVNTEKKCQNLIEVEKASYNPKNKIENIKNATTVNQEECFKSPNSPSNSKEVSETVSTIDKLKINSSIKVINQLVPVEFEIKTYSCDACCQCFKKRADYKNHCCADIAVRDAHKEPKVKSYACEKSTEMFPTVDQFQNNCSSHVEASKLPLQPQIEVFNSDENLKTLRAKDIKTHCSTHSNRQEECSESGGRELRCNECMKTFRSENDLQDHCNIHFKKNEGVAPANANSLSRQDYLERFSKLDELKMDEGVHDLKKQDSSTSEYLPFHCPVCSRSFTLASGLKRHSHVHDKVANGTGEMARAFACKECPQTFLKFTELIKHKSLHSKELRSGPISSQSFKCFRCEVVFSSLRRLKHHSRFHARENEKKLQETDTQITIPKKYLRPLSSRRKFSTIKGSFSKCIATCNAESRLLDHAKKKENKDAKQHTKQDTLQKAKLGKDVNESMKCNICLELFSSFQDLTNHIGVNHDGKSKLTGAAKDASQCVECQRTFSENAELREHKCIHGLSEHVNTPDSVQSERNDVSSTLQSDQSNITDFEIPITSMLDVQSGYRDEPLQGENQKLYKSFSFDQCLKSRKACDRSIVQSTNSFNVTEGESFNNFKPESTIPGRKVWKRWSNFTPAISTSIPDPDSVENHTPDEKFAETFNCDNCTLTFESSNDLMWHNGIHGEVNRWTKRLKVDSSSSQESFNQLFLPSFVKYPSEEQAIKENESPNSYAQKCDKAKSLQLLPTRHAVDEQTSIETDKQQPAEILRKVHRCIQCSETFESVLDLEVHRSLKLHNADANKLSKSQGTSQKRKAAVDEFETDDRQRHKKIHSYHSKESSYTKQGFSCPEVIDLLTDAHAKQIHCKMCLTEFSGPEDLRKHICNDFSYKYIPSTNYTNPFHYKAFLNTFETLELQNNYSENFADKNISLSTDSTLSHCNACSITSLAKDKKRTQCNSRPYRCVNDVSRIRMSAAVDKNTDTENIHNDIPNKLLEGETRKNMPLTVSAKANQDSCNPDQTVVKIEYEGENDGINDNDQFRSTFEVIPIKTEPETEGDDFRDIANSHIAQTRKSSILQVDQYNCKNCSKLFATQESLKYHLAACSQKPICVEMEDITLEFCERSQSVLEPDEFNSLTENYSNDLDNTTKTCVEPFLIKGCLVTNTIMVDIKEECSIDLNESTPSNDPECESLQCGTCLSTCTTAVDRESHICVGPSSNNKFSDIAIEENTKFDSVSEESLIRSMAIEASLKFHDDCSGRDDIANAFLSLEDSKNRNCGHGCDDTPVENLQYEKRFISFPTEIDSTSNCDVRLTKKLMVIEANNKNHFSDSADGMTTLVDGLQMIKGFDTKENTITMPKNKDNTCENLLNLYNKGNDFNNHDSKPFCGRKECRQVGIITSNCDSMLSHLNTQSINTNFIQNNNAPKTCQLSICDQRVNASMVSSDLKHHCIAESVKKSSDISNSFDNNFESVYSLERSPTPENINVQTVILNVKRQEFTVTKLPPENCLKSIRNADNTNDVGTKNIMGTGSWDQKSNQAVAKTSNRDSSLELIYGLVVTDTTRSSDQDVIIKQNLKASHCRPHLDALTESNDLKHQHTTHIKGKTSDSSKCLDIHLDHLYVPECSKTFINENGQIEAQMEKSFEFTSNQLNPDSCGESAGIKDQTSHLNAQKIVKFGKEDFTTEASFISLKCDECLNEFSTMVDLLQHQSIHHTGETNTRLNLACSLKYCKAPSSPDCSNTYFSLTEKANIQNNEEIRTINYEPCLRKDSKEKVSVLEDYQASSAIKYASDITNNKNLIISQPKIDDNEHNQIESPTTKQENVPSENASKEPLQHPNGSTNLKVACSANSYKDVNFSKYVNEPEIAAKTYWEVPQTLFENCIWSRNSKIITPTDNSNMYSDGYVIVNDYPKLATFKCKICKDVFLTQHDLTNHISCHAGSNQTICERLYNSSCKKEAYSVILTPIRGSENPRCVLIKLIKRVTENNGDSKDDNPEQITSAVHLGLNNTVEAGVQTEGKLYKCGYCSDAFLSENDAKIHSRVHSTRKHSFVYFNPKRIRCFNCPKMFSSISYLKIHSSVHNRKRQISVFSNHESSPRKTCSKVFPTNNCLKNRSAIDDNGIETTLKNQNQNSLTKESVRLCSFSPFVGFSNPNIACTKCNKTSTAPSLAPVENNIWFKLMSSIDKFKSNIQNLSKRNSARNSKTPTVFDKGSNSSDCCVDLTKDNVMYDSKNWVFENNPVKLYICEHCSKYFLSESNLKIHSSTHTDEVQLQMYNPLDSSTCNEFAPSTDSQMPVAYATCKKINTPTTKQPKLANIISIRETEIETSYTVAKDKPSQALNEQLDIKYKFVDASSVNQTTINENNTLQKDESVSERNKTVFCCKFCLKLFPTQADLKSHMDGHSDGKLLDTETDHAQILCETCLKRFLTFAALTEHKETCNTVIQHTTESQEFLSFGVCSENVQTSNDLYDQTTYHNQKYESDNDVARTQCLKKVLSSTKLANQQHFHKVQSKKLPRTMHKYIWRKNGSVCIRKRVMTYSYFLCRFDDCCKIFVNASDFLKHLTEHPVKSEIHMQPSLGKTYVRNKNIKDKMIQEICKNKDTSKCPAHIVKCKECSKSFSSITEFKRHCRSHTQVKHVAQQVVLDPFICEICTAMFFTTADIQHHVNSHTKTSPFICTECSIKFTTYSDFNKHRKIHFRREDAHPETEDRGSKCLNCSSTFKASNSLKNVYKILDGNLKNTGKRSAIFNDLPKMPVDKKHHVAMVRNKVAIYNCSGCSMRFLVLTDLIKHYLKHDRGKIGLGEGNADPDISKVCLNTSKSLVDLIIQKNNGISKENNTTKCMFSHSKEKEFPSGTIFKPSDFEESFKTIPIFNNLNKKCYKSRSIKGFSSTETVQSDLISVGSTGTNASVEKADRLNIKPKCISGEVSASSNVLITSECMDTNSDKILVSKIETTFLFLNEYPNHFSTSLDQYKNSYIHGVTKQIGTSTEAYFCFKCFEFFLSPREYNKHRLEQEKGACLHTPRSNSKNREDIIYCHYCPKIFSTLESYIKHNRIHTLLPNTSSLVISSCSECPRTFLSFETLSEHQKIHHKRNQIQKQIFITPRKKVIFSTDPSYNNISSNEVARLKFLLKGSITHILNKQKSAKYHSEPLKCCECFKVFASLDYFKLHDCVLAERKENGVFSCKLCPDAYQKVSPVVSHEYVSSKKFCFDELQRYVGISSMDGNFTSATQVKRFHCNECSRSFTSACEFKVHCSIHLRRNRMREEIRAKSLVSKGCIKSNEPKECVNASTRNINVQNSTRNGRFRCKECLETFSSVSDFKDHCSTHFNESDEHSELHAEPIVATQFAISEESNNSINIANASQVKRYKCKYCPRTFSSACEYKVHCSIHFKRNLIRAENRDRSSIFKECLEADSLSSYHKTSGVIRFAKNLLISKTPCQTINCKDCPKTFNSLRDYAEHRWTQWLLSSSDATKCKECPHTFTSLPDYENHRWKHFLKSPSYIHGTGIHSSEIEKKPLFSCIECSEYFTSLDDLQIHRNIHANKQQGSSQTGFIVFNRTKCPKSLLSLFDFKTQTIVHVSENQGELESEVCSDCSKSFSSDDEFKNQSSMHSVEKVQYMLNLNLLPFRM